MRRLESVPADGVESGVSRPCLKFLLAMGLDAASRDLAASFGMPPDGLEPSTR